MDEKVAGELRELGKELGITDYLQMIIDNQMRAAESIVLGDYQSAALAGLTTQNLFMMLVLRELRPKSINHFPGLNITMNGNLDPGQAVGIVRGIIDQEMTAAASRFGAFEGIWDPFSGHEEEE